MRAPMKTPPGLQPLIDDGVIDEVLRSLKSGKEATVYTVRTGDQIRCAKVYRDMGQRSFQKRAQYQEGRKVRGSRQARAMAKSTRFGRKEAESAWKNTEVDALYKLVEAGVRVPKPFGYFNDTLVMELVTDATGDPAPRLGEVDLSPDTAREYHAFLIRQIVRMLSIGLIHGDLSEFNVLVDAVGSGDHRPAAGGKCGGQQRGFRDAGARREQHPRHAGTLCARVVRDRIRARDLGAVRSGRSAGGQRADGFVCPGRGRSPIRMP